jgi:hypothetical protein
MNLCIYSMPITVATRSEAWFCGRSVAGMAGSKPAGSMVVCCECCVLSCRGLCFGLITRQEQSYRVWCVWVWSWSPDEKAPAHYRKLRLTTESSGSIQKAPAHYRKLRLNTESSGSLQKALAHYRKLRLTRGCCATRKKSLFIFYLTF